jgi:hypothetical protein
MVSFTLHYRTTGMGSRHLNLEDLLCRRIFRDCPRPNKRYKKGRAVPFQAWSGPEGSRELRLPDFMTTAQDGGKVVSLTHRSPLPPGNTPGTHFC